MAAPEPTTTPMRSVWLLEIVDCDREEEPCQAGPPAGAFSTKELATDELKRLLLTRMLENYTLLDLVESCPSAFVPTKEGGWVMRKDADIHQMYLDSGMQDSDQDGMRIFSFALVEVFLDGKKPKQPDRSSSEQSDADEEEEEVEEEEEDTFVRKQANKLLAEAVDVQEEEVGAQVDQAVAEDTPSVLGKRTTSTAAVSENDVAKRAKQDP